VLYEYYWERNYPQTPTIHALRGDDYKYIRYHGVWDVDELFDLKADPAEENNLIFSPGHEHIVQSMNERLFAELSATQGLAIPIREDTGDRWNLRRADGPGAATFPVQLLKR
jgi:N-acetylglucosamine-6-sulfatase